MVGDSRVVCRVVKGKVSLFSQELTELLAIALLARFSLDHNDRVNLALVGVHLSI